MLMTRYGKRCSICEYYLLSPHGERSGSVVECLIRDRGATGSSLTSFTALYPLAGHNNSSLVLVQPRKTHPFITERLLMGHNKSNKQNLNLWTESIQADQPYFYRPETIKSALDVICICCVTPRSQLNLLESIPLPENLVTPAIRYVSRQRQPYLNSLLHRLF